MSQQVLKPGWDENSHNVITIGWSIEDIQTIRPDLNDEQAKAVLKRLEEKHDASIGVNWEIIEYHAGELYSDPEA